MPRGGPPAPGGRDQVRSSGWTGSSLWRALGSAETTALALILMMVLVFFGTLHQVQLGTWLAQKKYFSSWVVVLETGSGWRLPVFPGGYAVGGLWLLNLVASHTVRARWEWRRAGLLLTHAGLFVLLLGQGLTQMFSRETQMAVEEGGSRNYSENFRDTELAVVDISPADRDVAHVIASRRLAREGPVRAPGLPFEIEVRRFHANAVLGRDGERLADRGLGEGVAVRGTRPTTADDEMNNVTAFLRLRAEGKDLGTWLVSTAIEESQRITWGGRDFLLSLRPERTYHPFTIALKDFRHDRYPGTDIPKNFSSRVRLTDAETGEDRDAQISMNNPLRYRGLTFFQSSFGKNDTLSVFQVVRNPVWITPYLATGLISIGLAWHFLAALARFRGKRVA